MTNRITTFLRISAVIFQSIAVWFIYAQIMIIRSKDYSFNQPSGFILKIDQFLAISKFYDLKLVELIINYSCIFFLFMFFSYLSSLAYLRLNAKNMKWGHKCLSAALWENVLKRSFNYCGFLGCNVTCMGREISGFSNNNISALISNENEQRIGLIQIAVCTLGVFMFLYIIPIEPIELAIFFLLSSYLIAHSIFEVIAVRFLRGNA